ncbi:MAG TPA: type II secretion system F family protein [Tepidisphaeraceae bacterium]|jgi:type IV pilus assembly protein PilC|nr:type II secretion system F family protein [Tepidisphaeraceae bacterium]
MANFAYTARDESGAAVNGTITAASINEASQLLRAQKQYPVSIRPAGAGASSSSAGLRRSSGGIKISRQDLIQLSTQMATMIETGVTLSEALECIGAQADKNPRLKKLIDDLSLQVQSGTDFSSALARHPRSFPRLYIALIKASEKSGLMSKLLMRATNYLRDEQETLRRVKGALTYPAIMLSFAILTTVFLLAFVLPRFTVIYASKGAALPMPTQVLMAMSNVVVGHWLLLSLGVAVTAIAGTYYFRTPGGQRVWHFTQIRLPLMGAMFRKLHLSRGMRMIGTMAGAGVSLMDCVETARELCGNGYYRDMWSAVLTQIQSGKQMSEPMSQTNLVPRSVAQMIHAGEKGGKLAFVMEQISGFAETELKENITELTRYIEPAMIIVMGVIIGGVAMALMLPIFTISRVVAH